MRGLWGDPSRVVDEHLDGMWEALVRAEGRARLPAITQ
jgi:hypothetical protein